MALLRNVKVNWASVIAPNTQFEPCWEVQALLTDEQANELLTEAKKLNKKGIKIKKDDNGQLVYRFRRRVARADGNGENSPPFLCGPGGKNDLWDKSKLIGNGSICNIQYLFIPYKNKFGEGITVDFKGLQIIEHVPYGVQDGEEFDEATREENQSDTNEFDDNDDF